MSTNISKQKRDKLIEEITEIRSFIANSMQDENTSNLLSYLDELLNEVNGKRYGLVYEEHREAVDTLLENAVPVLNEEKDLFVQNGGEMNFLIEGDNFASLKLLEKTHKGKIDVIYIDPPYNTGNRDFIYDDNFVDSIDTFRHSKWLSFMKKRLAIARNLLSEKGVIFISIDDNEQAALKILCDEVFGISNFITNFIWRKTSNPNSTGNNIGIEHEYILCYSKTSNYEFNGLPLNKDDSEKYTGKDEYLNTRGPYKLVGLNKTGTVTDLRPNLIYDITAPDGSIIKPSPRWRWSKEKLEVGIKENRIVFNKFKNKWSVSYKQYLNEDTNGNIIKREKLLKTILDTYGRTTDGTAELNEIIGRGEFDFPKPSELIKILIFIATKTPASDSNVCDNSSSTILDFFAGSGTTGHAVLALNNEDGGHRKFILCTNNENQICRKITYERLKTVITGNRANGSEYSDGLPGSLKYFKVDFLPISEKLYYEYADELLLHVRELVELENALDFDSDKTAAIVLDDDELEEFVSSLDENSTCRTLYMGHDVLPSSRQERIIKSHGIAVNIVPEYYYSDLNA